MLYLTAAATLALASTALAQSSSSASSTIPNTSTGTAAIASEVATATPLSPVSNVKGKAFDRLVVLMMENIDLIAAQENPNMAALGEKGIVLTNYFGTTHPSEPQYCAIHGGDNFGMDNDNFNQIPANVSTIWDLLEAGGVSYGEYQEDLPYPGFEGYQYLDPVTGANNYVRKHNPAILYNNNAARFNTIKSLDQFYIDLDNNELPQYMFITPNMLNDAHDTGIVYGADWLYPFLEPLLTNENFMNNTLLVINFDEDETYTIGNRVMTTLISDVMPKELINTTDDNFYSHYSVIATMEANWGLHHLGRWDTWANVFNWVADLTGDVVRAPDVNLNDVFLNQSYPGAMASTYWGPMPAPNVSGIVNGRTVFPDVLAQWGDLQECSYYDDRVVPPDGLRLPKPLPAECLTLGPKPLSGSTSSSSSSSSTGYTSSSSSATVTSSSSVILSTGYTSASGLPSSSSSSSGLYLNSSSTVTSSVVSTGSASLSSSTSSTISSGESSSAVSYTTSTVYSTSVSTVTSCAPTVTDCPANSISLTTVVVAVSTTVCPVTETEATSTPTSVAQSTSAGVSIASSQASITSYSTSTIYTTYVSTIISCAPTVTDCPANSITLTTMTVAISTTICPITAAEGTSSEAVLPSESSALAGTSVEVVVPVESSASSAGEVSSVPSTETSTASVKAMTSSETPASSAAVVAVSTPETGTSSAGGVVASTSPVASSNITLPVGTGSPTSVSTTTAASFTGAASSVGVNMGLIVIGAVTVFWL